ncbi:MAG: aryl-sulfate sulfotransferase [Planctomycetes bacterium]|nr:aryl-sulfate sulfotransferase [Planctomycetota bacterium]
MQKCHHGLGAALAALALHAAPAAQTPGLRLFQPVGVAQTHIVDENGVVVHSWPAGQRHVTAHMLDDGTFLRGQLTSTVPIGGASGRLQQVALDGTVLWDLLIDGPAHYMHHDIEPMPNGNVLVIAWDGLLPADAIAAGRDPATVTSSYWYPDSILEVRRTGPTTGAVVWEWHLMDHLVQDFDPSKPGYGVVANHPELLDINYPPVVVSDGDWNHCNGLDYDPINDLIVLSARSQNEIYIIDHSTTTAEAAGHTGGHHGRGGDILYRWGNPEAYGAGTAANQQLFGQHDARFVPAGYPGAGHVTVFNNSYLAAQSAVFELALPRNFLGRFVLDPVTGRYGPTAPSWVYTDPSFFSALVSSAQRLANGNTLVCSGAQMELFEVDPAGTKVWSYVHPTTPGSAMIFQAHLIERSLWCDASTLSIGGGRIGFDHLVGSASAGDFQLLLGSMSGTAPGTPVAGGVVLPLNFDFLTAAMASQFNNGLFVDTLGVLDGNGAASSSIVVGPGLIPPALIGAHLDFAHIVFDGSGLASRASNRVRVELVP